MLSSGHLANKYMGIPRTTQSKGLHNCILKQDILGCDTFLSISLDLWPFDLDTWVKKVAELSTSQLFYVVGAHWYTGLVLLNISLGCAGRVWQRARSGSKSPSGTTILKEARNDEAKSLMFCTMFTTSLVIWGEPSLSNPSESSGCIGRVGWIWWNLDYHK